MEYNKSLGDKINVKEEYNIFFSLSIAKTDIQDAFQLLPSLLKI